MDSSILDTHTHIRIKRNMNSHKYEAMLYLMYDTEFENVVVLEPDIHMSGSLYHHV